MRKHGEEKHTHARTQVGANILKLVCCVAESALIVIVHARSSWRSTVVGNLRERETAVGRC